MIRWRASVSLETIKRNYKWIQSKGCGDDLRFAWETIKRNYKIIATEAAVLGSKSRKQ